MIAFAKRNLKLYFRDRSSVFFSLLAVFIIIGLYVFFLGDTWTDSVDDVEGMRTILDNWVMAGVLSVTGVTTTLGMLGTMVKDRSEKIMKDFYVSPVKKTTLAGGYYLAAYFIGNIMTFITFILAEIYIVADGGEILGLKYMFMIIVFTLFSNLMNTSIILFLVSIFKSMNAFSTAITIIGTLIGFLTGIYIPIGSFPNAVQWVIKCFPISHSAALFRQIMMHESMETAFSGAPKEVIAQTKEWLGVYFVYGDYQLNVNGSILVIIITAVVFFVLASIILNKKQK